MAPLPSLLARIFPAGKDVEDLAGRVHRDWRGQEIIEDKNIAGQETIEEPQSARIRRVINSEPVTEVIESPVSDGVILPAGGIDESLSQIGPTDTGLAEDDHVRRILNPGTRGEPVNNVASQLPVR